MTADVHHLPSRMPTPQLAAEMAAALATRHVIDAIGQLVRLPTEQRAALSAEQLETMANVLRTVAGEVRMLKLMSDGGAA